jgi:hypothetical protein
MILTLEQKFEVELPTGWRELPPAHVLAVGDWIFEWVEEIGVRPDLKPNLIRALGETADFVLANLSENRSWVAVLDPSDYSRVRGVASVVALPASEAADSITAPAVPIHAVNWMSEQFDTTIAGSPAVVLHDIAVHESLVGPELAERFVGTVFSGDSSVVQLEILAEDLDVFRDIVALGTTVLAGLRFVDED